MRYFLRAGRGRGLRGRGRRGPGRSGKNANRSFRSRRSTSRTSFAGFGFGTFPIGRSSGTRVGSRAGGACAAGWPFRAGGTRCPCGGVPGARGEGAAASGGRGLFFFKGCAPCYARSAPVIRW